MKPPVCSRAAPGKVPLHRAHRDPFQQDTYNGDKRGRCAVLQARRQPSELSDMGSGCVRQRRCSGVLNDALTVTPGRNGLAWLPDDRTQLRGEALADQ